MKKLNILIENKCFTLMNKMFKIFFLLRNILYIYNIFFKTFKYKRFKNLTNLRF